MDLTAFAPRPTVATPGPTTIGSLDVYRAERRGWTVEGVADIAKSGRVLGLCLAIAAAAEPDLGERDGPGLLEPGQAQGGAGHRHGHGPARAVPCRCGQRAAAFLRGQLITEPAADVVAGRLPATLP